MSFNTSSRQLPNTDGAPPRDEPTPEPLADTDTGAGTDANAETETDADADAGEVAAASGEEETSAGPAPGIPSAGEPAPTAPTAGAASLPPQDSTGTPSEPASTATGTESETGGTADPDETGDPDGAGTDTDDTPDRTAGPEEEAAEVPGGAAGGGEEPPGGATPVRGRRGWRDRHPAAARTLTWTTTVLAAALVLSALLMPSQADLIRPAEFMRLPVEAILAAALLIVLPRRPRIVVAALAGLGLGVLTVLNFLDIGFNEYLGRGFNVVLDWPLFKDAQAYLQDTFGKTGATGIAVLAVVLVIAVLTLMALSVVRLGNLLSRHTESATRTTLVLAIAWVTCAATGVEFSGVPVASEHVALTVQDRAARVRKTLRDEAEFAKFAKKDTFANTPPDQLLTDLRGKDMMITFIESYGRSAIEDPVMAPGVDATLASENEKLTGAGFAARSGWLTSATYGGSSWLGHSTFLSGLWVNNQQRYRTVTAGHHLTLPGAFEKTGGWETVGVMPGVQKAWPEQKFYGIDRLYDSRDLGYQGPKFSWSTMPDQYALTAFERLEHGRKHDKPLMSTIILTSSHQPWAPLPKTVPDDQVGDGSVYDSIEKAGKTPGSIITDSRKSKEEYGKSIQYSVTSLIDYLVKYGNKDTVLIFLGDHQPLARVSGNHASRDVPVSIVAKDPKVLDRIADWGWADGLRPGHDTPVWKMDKFRDRFLTAYGSTPHP